MRKGKLGRGVAVVGAGMSKFGTFPEKASRDLFVEAFNEAVGSVERGLEARDIQAIYVGNFSSDLFEGQGHLAPIMADWVGLVPRPASRFECACASGAVALRQAIITIASGLYDIVLVGGVEKMTNLPTEKVTDTLAAASDTLYETTAGITFPGVFAITASAYFSRFGASEEHLMRVAIKNHNNGGLNPKAQFGSIGEIMKRRLERARQRGEPLPTWRDEMDFIHDPRANPVVAWPLRLFDCSPVSDGAACLVLVAEDLARDFSNCPIYAVGTGQGSGGALHTRKELYVSPAARAAAKEAYEMAGVKPDDIHMAEVHDCFTIAEITATEDLGFFELGGGARAAEEGITALNGTKPINTSGGLKSKGHPVGATGIAQVIEIWQQLRGEAGQRQLPAKDLCLGLTHNLGGTGGTCVVHIFERR